jgi:glutamate/tyrosine decarboxylase-like PLP-dependent enzyme
VTGSDPAGSSRYERPLARAAAHASEWLLSVRERAVAPRATTEQMLEVFGGPLPAAGTDPADVVEALARDGAQGLLAIQSGRFFGWVMGGTLPAALAADWLTSAWDQNAGMWQATPTVAALEHVAGQWLLELFGLPGSADVGFTTGATMANFTGLAAARFAVLERAGWNVHRDGLIGAPRVHVLVGRERHDTVDLALRYLGLGQPTEVAADDQGRIDPAGLARALAAVPDGEPLIVCLQAGNLHSGAFDPFAEAIPQARRRGAWVHVDGAFGLWAAASPTLRHLTRSVDEADSWATDAHKTLNVPYDCGIIVVRDSRALRTAMGVHASYLPGEDTGPGHPFEKVPELSRRARGVPVAAALRQLGRDGVAAQVEGLVRHARAIADGVQEIPGAEVLNDVVYTQVVLAVGDDSRTQQVASAITGSGEAWISASSWRGRPVLRISVSNAATDDADARRTVAAIQAAMAAG